jgi:hypothetical protein
MGKPEPPPPDEQALVLLQLIEEKAAELKATELRMRETIRELHGATRDAVSAKRGLLSVLSQIDVSIEEHIDRRLTEQNGKFAKTLVDQGVYLNERIAEVDIALREHFARLSGARSLDDLLAALGDEIARSIGPGYLELVEKCVERDLPGITRKALGLTPGKADVHVPLFAVKGRKKDKNE